MYDVVVKECTFAISSADAFLFLQFGNIIKTIKQTQIAHWARVRQGDLYITVCLGCDGALWVTSEIEGRIL